MKKEDSWSSEFRKKRFYENKEIKSIKKWDKDFREGNSILYNPLWNYDITIAVMLDLDGTCDNIDDNKASVFIQQLELLRKKFDADYCTISISTHADNPKKIIGVLDILNRNLTENIKIGTSFYYGGKYIYDTKSDIYVHPSFNYRKIDTFISYYVEPTKPKSVPNLSFFQPRYVGPAKPKPISSLSISSDNYDEQTSSDFNSVSFRNKWFAIVDDCIDENTYKKFQKSHPMLLARPSQHYHESYNDNFMSISTTTDGFDGVIEIFDKYIDSINNLDRNEILDTQKNMITHLSWYELKNKILNKDYIFIERYFREGYADFDDYRKILNKIDLMISNLERNNSEELQLRKLYSLIAKLFKNYLIEEKSKSKTLVKTN